MCASCKHSRPSGSVGGSAAVGFREVRQVEMGAEGTEYAGRRVKMMAVTTLESPKERQQGTGATLEGPALQRPKVASRPWQTRSGGM